MGGEGIRRHALPVEGFRTSGGAAVLDLLEAEAQPTLDIFRGVEQPMTEPPSVELVERNAFSVEVQNGARIAGIAASTAEELAAAGFVVTEAVDSPNPVTVTEVRYPSSLAAAAATLGTSLVEPPNYVVDESQTLVVLVIGPAFAGLADAAAADPAAAPTDAAPSADQAAPVEEPPAPEPEIVGVVPSLGPPGTPCA